MNEQVAMGGQALVEGVMMKTTNYVSAAARKPDKKISTIKRKHVSLTQKFWLWRMPVFRGAIVLGEMLVVGLQMLNWSANQQATKKEDKLSALETGLTLFVSLGLAVVLFILAPYWLSKFFVETRGVLFNLLDGLFRIIIFVGYVAGISLMKDVRRMFEYHGAEHMAVHCHEAQKKLIPENVRKYSPVHPRCGTSLLMFVIIVSILVFSLIHWPQWYINVPARIILIPLIAGISYELLKLSAKFPNNFLLKILMLPGLWVQKITTRKPHKDQIEVAITALKQVV